MNKLLKPLCVAYNDVVTAYNSSNVSELRTTITKHQDLFSADNNLGLVKQVLTSQTRSNIRRLTRTFITLSLGDLATRVGLSSTEEVEQELVIMIQTGSIHATISQQVSTIHSLRGQNSHTINGSTSAIFI